jgi:hypothetical protein
MVVSFFCLLYHDFLFLYPMFLLIFASLKLMRMGAAPLAVYGAVVAAPAVTNGVSGLFSSPLAASVVRSSGIGAAGGLAGQAISDTLNSVSTGSVTVSSPKEYTNSAIKGAVGGVVNEFGGLYTAGVAVAGVSYGLNKIQTGKSSFVGPVLEGATTITGGKLVNSASGIPGRLPNPGTANFYMGQHAQQLGLGELTQNIFSAVVNLFKPNKK